eukprot:4429215-Pyramimonas_sp.AAC.1
METCPQFTISGGRCPNVRGFQDKSPMGNIDTLLQTRGALRWIVDPNGAYPSYCDSNLPIKCPEQSHSSRAAHANLAMCVSHQKQWFNEELGTEKSLAGMTCLAKEMRVPPMGGGGRRRHAAFLR